ncbi:energy-coupling factor transporter transmembrane component T family protein [Microbacterium sp. A93]|uniref:energy-coupling factor transporter transmembrane component T family protein n=1 Tax=Microbacterium sp. A93 TaxID=3450716 RepID=UPI003F443B81
MRDAVLVQRLRKPIDLGNPIANFQPMNLLVMFIAVVLVGTLGPDWRWPLAACAAFLIIGWCAGRGRAHTGAFIKLLLAVGLILFVLRALLTPGRPVMQLGPVAVTEEGLWAGLDFSLRVMVICAAVSLFFIVVPRPRLALAIERMGASPHASYVILASFQAITDLGKNTRVVLDAQKARGVETEKNLGNRIKAIFPVLAPVFLVALSQTEERAIALEARAFNVPTQKTALLQERSVPVAEWVAVGAVIIISIVAIIGGVSGWFSHA